MQAERVVTCWVLHHWAIRASGNAASQTLAALRSPALVCVRASAKHAAGRVLQLDNFRRLKGFGWPGFSKMNLFRQDKGQHACVAAFLDALNEGQKSPIPSEEIFEVARVTIQAALQLREQ